MARGVIDSELAHGVGLRPGLRSWKLTLLEKFGNDPFQGVKTLTQVQGVGLLPNSKSYRISTPIREARGSKLRLANIADGLGITSHYSKNIT